MAITLFKTWLALLVLLTHQVTATYWTVTSYYAISKTTSQLGGDTSCTAAYCYYTYKSTLTLVPAATPTAKAISTSRYTQSFNDITVVYVYVDAEEVRAADIMTTRSRAQSGVYTEYVQPVIYTAPASCPTPFTVSTYTQVNIPDAVTQLYAPRSTATKVYSFTSQSYLTYYTMFLAPDELPLTGDPMTGFVYTYYIASCRNPTATGAAYYSPNDGLGRGSEDFEICSGLTGCTTLRTWVIVVATLLPTIFLLGFLESWLWFRRLMLGKSALRFGTVCWCLLTLWVACFTRMSPSRTEEEQKVLRERWSVISGGQRVKLWFKWGFRHSYPTELLGPDPRVAVPGASTGAGQSQGGQPPFPGSMSYGQPPYPGQPSYPGFLPYPQSVYAPGAEKTPAQDQVSGPIDPTHPQQQPPFPQAPYPAYPVQGYPAPGAPIMYMGQQYMAAQPPNSHYSVSTLSSVPGQPHQLVAMYPTQAPSPAQTLVRDPQAAPATSPTVQQGQQQSHELGDPIRGPEVLQRVEQPSRPNQE